MMYQIMEHLIGKGIDPKRILYFSFDEETAREPDAIENAIRAHAELALKDKEKNAYVFFDEVQYIDGWQAVLKRYYDMNLGIKFFVSGSASLFIKKKSRESLAGRVYEFVLRPMTFREFLRMRGFEKVPEKALLSWGAVKSAASELEIYKEELQLLFHNYVTNGGFPENLAEVSLDRIHEYVKSSVTDRIIYHDLPAVFKVRQPSALLEMMKMFAAQPCGIVEYGNLADALKISKPSASNYVSYLEESFLVRVLRNYTGSYEAGARKAKKVCLADHSIGCALIGMNEEMFRGENLGKIVESMVVNHVQPDNFWRERKYEVDAVIRTREGFLPIEVKYKERIQNSDLEGLARFIKKRGAKKAIVVTKGTLKRDGTVLFVPAYVFLACDFDFNRI